MGAGRRQKIGNKYFLGFHHVVAEKIDAVVELVVARKSLWRGYWSGGSLNINKPDHMGGDEKEGGISGKFDLMTGDVTQGVNAYLQSAIGGVISAYRGVVSLVANKVHIGSNTGRLPDWWVKMVNVSEVVGEWRPDVARGHIDYYSERASYHITIPVNEAANEKGAQRNAAVAAMVRAMVGTTNDIRVIALGDGIEGDIERIKASDADYEDVAQWIEALPTSGGWANYSPPILDATYDALDFHDRAGAGITLSQGGILSGTGLNAFNALVGGGAVTSARRSICVMIVIDGSADNATVGANVNAATALLDANAIEVYAAELDGTQGAANQIDNTPEDGVPVISETDPETSLLHILNMRFVQWVDLNAAHHIRYLLTTPARGGTADAADIGDTFEAAADQFADEGFYLSVPYSDFADADSCIKEIQRHVDCQVYQDKSTGKWEIELIRPNYTVASLPLLDDSLVTDWSGLEDVAPTEAPNQLTVTYTKRNTDEPGSETRANVAAVRKRGRVIPAEPVDYPFITYRPLAVKVCLRDVGTISAPRKMGSLTLRYLPDGLHLGSAVRLTNTILQLSDFVVRITEISEPDGIDNSVTIKVTEDRFVTGATLTDNEPAQDTMAAQPADPRVVMEAPYYVLATTGGQTDIDDELASNEQTGFLMSAAGAPTPQSLSAALAVDSGSGYVQTQDMAFSPVATLQSALTRGADDVTVLITASLGLETVEANSLASIGDEIVRVDNMVISGSLIELTLGRGCVDTVPVAHDLGDKIIFWGPGDPDEDRYIDGQTVDVKMMTHTVYDDLEVADAPVDTVTFDSRAIRPYPPGNFKVNGSYADDQTLADVALTWAHRDRLLQTTLVPEDHGDGDIGPEAGTTYTVRAEAITDAGTSLGVYYTATGITVTTHDYPDATARPSGTDFVLFSVASVRDGYESWQKPVIRVSYTSEVLITPEGDDLITPEGDNLITGE